MINLTFRTPIFNQTDIKPRPKMTYGAGVLPISWVRDPGSPSGYKCLFLLGRDGRDNHWSDFAGRSERSDASVATTAAREFWEESYGLVTTDPKAFRSRLNNQVSIVLQSRTQNNLPFWCFVTEIPFIQGLRPTFLKTVAFLKHRNVPKLYIEKTDVQYYTLHELLGGDPPKRGVFRVTIDQHRDVFERIAGEGPFGFKRLCAELAGCEGHAFPSQ